MSYKDYLELPEEGTRPLSRGRDVDVPAAKATSLLMDIRMNTPVGYAEDPAMKRKIEERLSEATVMVNYVYMSAVDLGSDAAKKVWEKAAQLEDAVYYDFLRGLLPRSENDPTGIPGKDPDLAVEVDYTATDDED